MIADRLAPFAEPSIFDQIKIWIREAQAVDIASGQPNWKTPQFAKDILIEILNQQHDQYGNPGGQLELKNKLAEIFSEQLNRTIDGNSNVYIGLGASGVLTDCCHSLINTGDEVIVFDPHFPHHTVCPRIYGASIKAVQMKAPTSQDGDWEIDFEEIEAAFSDKTKMLWLCSPHNPTGKIFTEEEYKKIEKILLKFPKVVVLSDEVYDFLVFDKIKYTRFANISEEMFQRTITVGSLGKLFSCTGWRCGYAISTPQIIKALVVSQQCGGYSTFKPSQMAFAKCLETMKENFRDDLNYPDYTLKVFQQNKDFVLKEFRNIQSFDWNVLPCHGGYFVLIDAKNIIPKIPLKYYYNEKFQDVGEACGKEYNELENPDFAADVVLTRFLLKEYKVAVLPTQAFFLNPKKDSTLIRISLSKKLDTIKEGLYNLQKKKKC